MAEPRWHKSKEALCACVYVCMHVCAHARAPNGPFEMGLAGALVGFFWPCCALRGQNLWLQRTGKLRLCTSLRPGAWLTWCMRTSMHMHGFDARGHRHTTWRTRTITRMMCLRGWARPSRCVRKVCLTPAWCVRKVSDTSWGAGPSWCVRKVSNTSWGAGPSWCVRKVSDTSCACLPAHACAYTWWGYSRA